MIDALSRPFPTMGRVLFDCFVYEELFIAGRMGWSKFEPMHYNLEFEIDNHVIFVVIVVVANPLLRTAIIFFIIKKNHSKNLKNGQYLKEIWKHANNETNNFY